MARKITEYDLLISCPGDIKEEIKVIEEEVDDFNRNYGGINNVKICVKHWSKHSYPELGDSPQNILNKQFIEYCDFAVAIFGTRFGTPTDEYGSGSEEEIEEMVKAGKQVFLYFLDKPVAPSSIDNEQYKKVQEYKQRCMSKGIVAMVGTEDKFRKDFRNHLALYFLSKISNSDNGNIANEKPSLNIKDYSLSNGSCSLKKFETPNNEKLNQFKGKIEDTIRKIKNIKILSKIKNANLIAGEHSWLNHFKGLKIEIETEKVVIKEYMDQNSISYDEGKFWSIGNLCKNAVQFNILNGTSNDLIGTEEEKSKYNLLMKLHDDIKIYYEAKEYYSNLAELSYLPLVLCNDGTAVDNDIDIKILTDKGFILDSSEFFVPGEHIIESLVNKMDDLLTIKPNENIVRYERKISIPGIPSMPDIPYIGRRGYSYEDEVEKYKEKIKKIFDCEYYSNEESDILCFKFKYIKHNTNIAFPCVILFKNAPQKVKYIISSANSPNKYEGEINLVNN